MSDQNVDVVIIGAGLSGLAAADGLNQVNQIRALQGAPPLSYVVLEARDRVGGRVLTAHPEYGWLDFGGAYVTLTQRYVQQYIAQFELPIITSLISDEDTRWKFQLESGDVLTLDSGSDPSNFPGKHFTAEVLGVLDSMTCDVRAAIDDPSKVLNAALYDSWSVSDFIENYGAITGSGLPMNDHTRQAFHLAVRSGFSVEPDELSFLFMLYYAARTGSFAMLADILSGPLSAEGTRLVHGAGQLAEGLVALLQPDALKLGVHVTEIDRSHPDSVTVRSASDTWTCQRLVVAVSPTVSGKITYTPALDQTPAEARRTRLSATMKLGRTIKGFLVYARPWWREMGFSGNTMATHQNSDRYPLDWALDNVWDPPARDADLPYPKHTASLMTFIVGRTADKWRDRTREERQEALVAQLEEIYGTSDARSLLVAYVEHDFSLEPLSAGCPSGVFAKGQFLDVFSALRAPIGRIHWAGTEAATDWCGYMDGALQSGLRAALEVGV